MQLSQYTWTRSLPFLCAAAMLTLAGAQVKAQTLVNGSFEAPVLAAGSYQDFTAGQTLGSGGWTVLGQDVLLIEQSYTEPSSGVTFNAQAGSNALDLTGIGNTGATDGIQQVIATTLGSTYAVSFYVGRAGGNASSPYQTPATIDLSVNGGPRQSFTNTFVTPGAVNFQQFTAVFTATSASTTLAFLNGTPQGNSYAGLDNVTIRQVAVPEPGSVALLAGMSLSGAGLLARRRKNARKAA